MIRNEHLLRMLEVAVTENKMWNNRLTWHGQSASVRKSDRIIVNETRSAKRGLNGLGW